MVVVVVAAVRRAAAAAAAAAGISPESTARSCQVASEVVMRDIDLDRYS